MDGSRRWRGRRGSKVVRRRRLDLVGSYEPFLIVDRAVIPPVVAAKTPFQALRAISIAIASNRGLPANHAERAVYRCSQVLAFDVEHTRGARSAMYSSLPCSVLPPPRSDLGSRVLSTAAGPNQEMRDDHKVR